jgi:hypothetical protein
MKAFKTGKKKVSLKEKKNPTGRMMKFIFMLLVMVTLAVQHTPAQTKPASNGTFEILGFDGKSVSFRAVVETPIHMISLVSGEHTVKATAISNTKGDMLIGGATAWPGSSLVLGKSNIRLLKDTETKCDFENLPAWFTPKSIVFLTGEKAASMSYDIASGSWIKQKPVNISEAAPDASCPPASEQGIIEAEITGNKTALQAAFMYEAAGDFHDGRAAVTLNNKVGFIDTAGNMVIPCIYDYDPAGWAFLYDNLTDQKDRKPLYEFSEGLAAVRLNRKWGYIDKSGKEVTPFKYSDYASGLKFCEGRAEVRSGRKSGFIDTSGREVIPLKYDGVYRFSEGLAGVKLAGKIGFADREGNEVIPLVYDDIFPFSNGIARVAIKRKWGLIDREGNEITACKYDEIYDFSEGLAAVLVNKKIGFIDETGQEIIPPQYENHSKITRNMLRSRFYSRAANYHLWKKYFDNCYIFSEGLATVCSKKKWGFIDKTGNQVIPFKYREVERFSNGRAMVDRNKQINKSGEEYQEYDDVKPFSEGLAKAGKKGKYGYVDTNWNMVIPPPDYYYIDSFSDGLAMAVRIDRSKPTFVRELEKTIDLDRIRIGFIDKSGKEAIPLNYMIYMYSGEKAMNHLPSFSEGFARVQDKTGLVNEGQWSFIDRTGRPLIPRK